MKEKIIQIIPAPAGLMAYFHDDSIPLDDQGRGTATSQPVCCLALVEVECASGIEREVRPMTIVSEGYADFPTDANNFVAVDYD